MLLPVGALVAALGIWRFATPPPQLEKSDLLGIALRCAAVATALLHVFMTFVIAYDLGGWLRRGLWFSQRQTVIAFEATIAASALTLALTCVRAARLGSRMRSFGAGVQAYAIGALAGLVMLATAAALWRPESVTWGGVQFVVSFAASAWAMIYFLALGMSLRKRAGMMPNGA